ncbi:MAG: hypothetical protein V1723_01395 [Candidatus Uhrbacteria bacterium]
MHSYIFILGREPHFSVAELAAVGSDWNWSEAMLGREALGVSTADAVDPVALLKRLGGTVKIGEAWMEFSNDDFLLLKAAEVAKKIVERVPGDGKIRFGISAYDCGAGAIRVNAMRKPLERLACGVKSVLAEQERSVRWVTSRERTLSSVVVVKNKLLAPSGAELLVLVASDSVILAWTLAVQPFEDWSRHDYGRPGRDARSGMLPPKLARMMVNLAFGSELADPAAGHPRPCSTALRAVGGPPTCVTHSPGAQTKTLLDPFCGSGTILTEAMMLGVGRIIGSDVSTTAIADAQRNIVWTREHFGASSAAVVVEQRDAGKLSQFMPPASIDAIVTEPYLGPPSGLRSVKIFSPSSSGARPRFAGQEEEKESITTFSPSHREGELEGVGTLRKLYLAAFHEFVRILKPGGRVVFVVPVFRARGREQAIDISADVMRLGFHRINPFPVALRNNPLLGVAADLPYARPNQRIGRQILIFER